MRELPENLRGIDAKAPLPIQSASDASKRTVHAPTQMLRSESRLPGIERQTR
jgi:hypothetical protein